MPQVEKLYHWLATGPAPDCDQILAAALERAESAWAERIVRVLQQRDTEAAWTVLVGHSEILLAEACAWLRSDPERLEATLGRVLRTRDPNARLNALRLLEERPSIRLMYSVADVLRDPDKRVRALAGQVLRVTADAVLRETQNLAPHDDAGWARRRQAVEALREALRTFPLHNRIEALQACLWFARELGAELWERLASPRSRAGMVAADNIIVWNDPRMAGFLVGALKYAAWRAAARNLIRTWKSPAQVSALFSQADLLSDDGIRRSAPTITRPAWFAEIREDLSRLSPAARAGAPVWVGASGLDEREKLALLSQWVEHSDTAVRAAALGALARISLPEAHEILERAALADADAQSVAPSEPEAQPEPAAETLDVPGEDTIEAFERLWTAGRDLAPAARRALIAQIRAHAPAWRDALRARLQAADPRDRVMALQVASTRKLVLRFRADLEVLTKDPIEGIRRLARTMIQSISPDANADGDAVAAECAPANASRQQSTAADADAPDAEDASGLTNSPGENPREELRDTLRSMINQGPLESDGRLVKQVRSLLRDAYCHPPGDDCKAADPSDDAEGAT